MRSMLVWLGLVVACGKSEPAVEKAAGDPAAAHGSGSGSGSGKREDRRQPAAPAKLALDVYTAGAKTVWGEAEFTAVEKIDGAASSGEARETWSLRDLVHHHFGLTARVITVIGEDGRQAIAPPAWDDAKRTPILHTTRRGTLKFRWADATGKWGETAMKEVTGIEIALTP